ncbi:unnamed protein product [Cunninghamella blakesleeana]
MVVLLPSSYDENNNTNKTSTNISTITTNASTIINTNTITTVINKNNHVPLDTILSKIIQIVLRARLGPDYYCIQPHTTNHCYLTISPTTLPFDNIQHKGIKLFICILYKNTLLEQWKITFNPIIATTTTTTTTATTATNNNNNNVITSPITSSLLLNNNNTIDNNNNNNNGSSLTLENTDIKLLLQAVYSQTRLLPIHSWISQSKLNKSDLSFIITPTLTPTTSSSLSSSTIINREEKEHPSSSPLSLCCYSNIEKETLHHHHHSSLHFQSDTSIGKHDFKNVITTDIQGQLKLQVVYNKQLDKSLSLILKPMNTTTDTASKNQFHPSLFSSPLSASSSSPSLSSSSSFISKSHINPPFFSSSPFSSSSPSSSFPSFDMNESISNYHPHGSTPVITMRRLSKLSLSALNDDEDEEDNNNNNNKNNDDNHHHFPSFNNNNNSNNNSNNININNNNNNNSINHHHPLAIPISSSPIQYTHHGHSLAYSTSPSTSFHSQQQSSTLRRSSIQYHHGLAGSYEESLLSGRMSTLQPSKPIIFHAQIGVLGHGTCKPSLKCPPHRSIIFPAFYYDHDEKNETCFSSSPSSHQVIQHLLLSPSHHSTIPPYVGTIDLTIDHHKKPSPGYRIPSKGQLQIAIKNPNKGLVKLFLIPYDVSKMPRQMKTFLRQKSYSTSSSSSPSVLKYAIHIQLCRTEKNRVYLYKHIRVVFANRCMDAREQYRVVCEGPKEPVYVSL